MLYGEVLLILKTSPITVGESTYVYIFLLPKSGYFCGALRKCGIFHELGVELGQIDIQTCYRIKNNRTIIKLSSRKDCLQVLRAKNRLTDLDGTTLNLPGDSKIFINKSPCDYYRGLWNKCKHLKGDNKIHQFYTDNEVIRLKSSVKTLLILTISRIYLPILMFTIYKLFSLVSLYSTLAVFMVAFSRKVLI